MKWNINQASKLLVKHLWAFIISLTFCIKITNSLKLDFSSRNLGNLILFTFFFYLLRFLWKKQNIRAFHKLHHCVVIKFIFPVEKEIKIKIKQYSCDEKRIQFFNSSSYVYLTQKKICYKKKKWLIDHLIKNGVRNQKYTELVFQTCFVCVIFQNYFQCRMIWKPEIKCSVCLSIRYFN